jgi:hydrogenase expression/formation protein HypE
MKQEKILLGHGSGGELSHELISELFVKYFSNPILDNQGDSALLEIVEKNISFTTDSFVVDPVFFPGGNIGKLAIAGTVNDLAVSGALPKYLSCGFILEEGLLFSDLEKIVKTMAEEAEKAGVKIVTGDTKVVDKGKCDKVFINTTGIGILEEKYSSISSGHNIKVGDKIIINGSIGDHGMAIMAKRNDLNLTSDIESDCACLNHLIKDVLDGGVDVKFMRDATRGGLSTVLNEIVKSRDFGLEIQEEFIPVKENVRGICELLGFDPIYVANEGKVVMVVPEEQADKTIEIIKKSPFGEDASVIGEITEAHPGKGWMLTSIGGKRIIDMLAGEQLPRIC